LTLITIQTHISVSTLIMCVTGYDNMTDVGLVWDKRDWSIQEHE
jgi:hypothetical protein